MQIQNKEEISASVKTIDKRETHGSESKSVKESNAFASVPKVNKATENINEVNICFRLSGKLRNGARSQHLTSNSAGFF